MCRAIGGFDSKSFSLAARRVSTAIFLLASVHAKGMLAVFRSIGPVHFLMIYICNFHVLSHLLLINICKLHWNPDRCPWARSCEVSTRVEVWRSFYQSSGRKHSSGSKPSPGGEAFYWPSLCCSHRGVSARTSKGNFLMIYICNFLLLSHLLLIYIRKLHWNLNTMFVCQVNYFWFTYVISMS